MKIVAAFSALALSFALAPAMSAAAESPPEWAYPMNPPGVKPPPDDGVPRRVPGSELTFTLTQIRDRNFSPVWHPGDHPALPEFVARGRKPDVPACGFCHRSGGTGGPENANLRGLPAAYFKQQVADFMSGARKSSVPKRNVDQKLGMFKDATEADIESAAAYFASLSPLSIVRVVESNMVPKTFVIANHLAAAAGGEKEPIAGRIIEVPEDLEQFANRDSRARFIAYVPPGAVKKGEALATTGGGGKTLQCSTCHGADLRGLGPIPGIAGRSPSYIVRQLYDFKNGTRAGSAAPLMKAAVEKLTVEDMLVLAAYAASLAP